VCPHEPAAGCACRKPAPALVARAADELGVDPADCVMIGDIGADAAAAYAAGARAILVPAPATLPGDRLGVPVAPTVEAAVSAVLAGRWPAAWPPGR
jgi:beta-phosphoglucomutase-like phosphatase (HAD superfamily)